MYTLITKLAFRRKKNQARPPVEQPKLLIPLFVVDSRAVTLGMILAFMVVWIHVPSAARAQFIELVKAVAQLSGS